MKQELLEKLLMMLLSDSEPQSKAINSSSITDSAIGKFVIVRSRNEGVNAGTLRAADDTGVILEDCRRIWYHKPT